jgi:hypothetical protein
MIFIYILLGIVVLMTLAVAGYFIWRFLNMSDKNTDKKLKEIVSEINNSNYYSYTFDKQQEENLKNMEANINSMANNYLYVKDNVNKVKSGYVRKDDLDKSITTDSAFIKNLYVGPFGFTNKGSANGVDWMYLYNGGKFDGGLAVKNFTTDKALLKDTVVNGKLRVAGNGEVTGSLNVSRDKGVCIGNVCLVETNGVLQACNSSYSNCKRVTLA